MNFLAHGWQFVDRPYFVAGTALPDWLSVVDRSVRVRSRLAVPLAENPDPELADVAEIARGVVRHHADDQWFHGTRAFAELSLGLTVTIRDALPGDAGFRPSFLGHILVEMLLDAELTAEQPERLEAYYGALRRVDGTKVADAVERMTGRRPERLDRLVDRFCQERFLFDYLEDAKLLFRLNQVMRRVKLAPLPEEFARLLPDVRQRVAEKKSELLTPPPIQTAAENAP